MVRLPTRRLSCLTEIVQKLVLTFRVSLSQCHDRWHKYVYQNMSFPYIYSLSQPIDNWIVHIITFSWLDSASIKQGARSVQIISLSIASIPASPGPSSHHHAIHYTFIRTLMWRNNQRTSDVFRSNQGTVHYSTSAAQRYEPRLLGIAFSFTRRVDVSTNHIIRLISNGKFGLCGFCNESWHVDFRNQPGRPPAFVFPAHLGILRSLLSAGKHQLGNNIL